MSALSADRAAMESVRERIDHACSLAGRDAASVTLVVATKTVAAQRIAAAGVVHAGENRVQELLDKQSALEGEPITWHLIGALQRNKVRKVVGRVSLIHSVDSLELGKAIGEAANGMSIVQPILVQVRLGAEATKSGCDPREALALVDSLRGIAGIDVKGLMTIPPPAHQPGAGRAAFAELASLAQRLDVPELSMGMSDDFEDAIAEGSTIVRVGSAIFGPRA